MYSARDNFLTPGDVVEIVGLQGSAGRGILKMATGSSHYLVEMANDTSRLMHSRNLRKVSRPDMPNYYICGTWDNWKEHRMRWNEKEKCFEYAVLIGENGLENFYFILDGDWKMCVYPDRLEAHPHMHHKIMGPDDNLSLGQEWAIGIHPKDKAAPGKSYQVYMFVHADGSPKYVDWIPMNEALQALEDHVGDPDKYKERAARMRLEKRFRTEQELMLFERKSKDDENNRLMSNLERYRMDIKLKLNIRNAEYLRGEDLRPKECTECGQLTGEMMGSMVCCNECWDRWAELRLKGWNPLVLCNGVTAGRLAEDLAAEGTLSRAKARHYVMGRYQDKFVL